jgi:alkanesulfonate monooxygenase SsuD/methylene tetrahydromethanopterin reductase-like flavin-dependent oxidoreductase (luciferase family)
MGSKVFRFAVQSVPQDSEQWLATAHRAEELGYSAVLIPDGPQLPSSLPALAIAAGATTTLRVGTFVLASPLRPPWLTAWDAHTLATLSNGRFEFGIGTELDVPELIAHDSLQLLRGTPAEMADELRRRRDTLGISYFSVNAAYADQFAPVVELLAGQ